MRYLPLPLRRWLYRNTLCRLGLPQWQGWWTHEKDGEPYGLIGTACAACGKEIRT